MKSVCPDPVISKNAIRTLPINASPYRVPVVTVQGDAKGKSTHAKKAPMVTPFDSLNKSVAEGELELVVAYKPASTEPEVPPYPSTYAQISVIIPEDPVVKYEHACPLTCVGKFPQIDEPTVAVPKEKDAGVGLGLRVGLADESADAAGIL